jgi:hypothetical protein
LRRRFNLNKTKISLDGSKTKVGGRPVVTFYDPHLPMPCVSVVTSQLSCTSIFGSSAASECIALHKQIPTTTVVVEHEKVRVHFL